MDTISNIQDHKFLTGCDKSIRTWGMVFTLSVFAIFGSWATLAPLDSATLAPAVVEVKSHRKTIQHISGGIIQEIHVKDGDLVKQGDLLLTLDGTEIQTQYETALTRSYEALAKLARLKAELGNLTSIPDTEKPSIQDQAFSAIWQTQQQTLKTRKDAREGEIAILDSQIIQSQQKIQRLKQLSDNKNQLARTLDIDLSDYDRLVKKGYLGKKNLRDLKRRAIEHRGEGNDLQAEANELETQIKEISLRKQQIQFSFQKEVTQEIELTKEQLYELDQQIPLLREQLNRLAITSPVAGRVIDSQIHTLRGVIGAGQAIMDIVPENDDLILTAKISPMDIEDVYPGLNANIRLTAFNTVNTPEVKGIIITVSADQLLNADNQPYFEAKISILKESLKQIQDIDLSAGMPAEVLILTGSRTFLEYLLKPLTDSISRSFIEK